MAKLQRKSAKLFASEATAAAGGLAQFGSLAAGTPNYSTDPDVIQALDAYKAGWSSAVLGTKSPALEDRNALDYLLSYQQAYIMQHGIPEFLDTETYYKNSYVIDSNGDLRVSLIDNNTGNDPADDNGALYWGYGGGSTGHQMGEVYYSQSSLATDNKGALPLFTGELVSNADNLYPQFYAWVNSHSELCVSESDWQDAITTYGECPYYVINTTNKTIRLPKLTNYVKMANTTDKITQASAGLPNITGSVGRTFANVNSGAFYQVNSTSSAQGGSGAGWLHGFDASRSSSVYGNSNTVTPAHTTLYPWVCVFNSAVTASVAQAAEFEDALISKAETDLSNLTAAGLAKFVGRTFTDLDVLVASGAGGIAGSYSLADLPNDNVIRLGIFQVTLQTTQAGHSSLALKTDVMTVSTTCAATNNQFASATTVILPIKTSVAISFPSTAGGIGSGCSVRFKGYL